MAFISMLTFNYLGFSGYEKRMRPPLGLRDYEVFSSKGNVFIVPDPSKGYPSKNPDSPFCVLGYNWRKLLLAQ
jgi:hypothetical protein